jgi:hypothetical protein
MGSNVIFRVNIEFEEINKKNKEGVVLSTMFFLWSFPEYQDDDNTDYGYEDK